MGGASLGSRGDDGFWVDLDGAPVWLHRLAELLPVQPQAAYVSFDQEQELLEQRKQTSALLVLSDRYLIHYEIAAEIDYWRHRGSAAFKVTKSMVPITAIDRLTSSARIGSPENGKQTILSFEGNIVLDRPLGDLGSTVTLPMNLTDYGDRKAMWAAAKAFIEALPAVDRD